MKKLGFSYIAIAIASGFVLSGCQADAPKIGETEVATLAYSLEKGGHTLYIRHAATETDYADQIKADPNNCATQRVLSEKGWHQARDLGAAFKRLNIPVGSVTSSEYCRAWKTADLAFGKYEKTSKLNFEKAEHYTDEQIAAMRDRVAPMLAAAVPKGTNAIIVGHDDPFEASTGIYPEPMGVTYVIKADGKGSFKVLGRIAPNEWPKQ